MKSHATGLNTGARMAFAASCLACFSIILWSANTYAGTVGIPPMIITQPMDQEVVVGGAAAFFVDVMGSEPISYQWRKDGSDIPGANDSMFSILGVDVSDAGSYDVTADNAFGSIASDLAMLTVRDGIPPSFIIDPLDQEVVVGSDVMFTVDAMGDEPISYQWRKDGSDIPGANDSMFSILDVGFSDAGSYDVTADNAFGLATSGPAMLTVVPEPSVGTLLAAVAISLLGVGLRARKTAAQAG